ncbi:MAG: histidinol dehydrogenase [Candidatus Desulfofervidus auxilii]|nr:histidinol dehydrogenase [Candidatus Desulfofervidus auxilii]
MKVYKIFNKDDLNDFKKEWQKRVLIPPEILQKVLKIIDDVRKKGDEAVIEYTKRFDKIDLCEIGIEIDFLEIERAFEENKEIIPLLKEAANRIKNFHSQYLPKSWFISDEYGNLLGQKVSVIERLGVYCPGGKAVYPSTVLMNVIPAKVAQVKEIFMCVPTPNGKISSIVLAAAKIAGVNKIFRIGGAQAIAALAYGTETIPKVDFICGPGNIYVAAAKKLVFGDVGIDMVAGPSEIAVIADGKVPPNWTAADLISQAEHDEMASAILITNSEEYAQAVLKEIERRLNEIPRKSIAKEAIKNQGYIFVVPDLEIAAEVANTIAPEHLELLIENPFSLLTKIKHAGAIFLGEYAVEAIGDYMAGPNHTLPTGGTARFSSVLSTEHFLKRSSILFISKEGTKALGPKVIALAHLEGLMAHALSVEERLKENRE